MTNPTQPLDLERMREPFEAHPALASWIERFAVTDMNMSLGDWMVFLDTLNAALSSERAARLAAEAQVSALQAACYVASEPHLSGYRVILGFDTLNAAQDAHEAIARLVQQGEKT